MSNSRKLKRGRKHRVEKSIKLPAGKFESIDLNSRQHPDWMTRAYANNRYVVMINDNAPTDKGVAIRAMIQRHDDKPIPGHWSEIQKIKNELFGNEAIGIEYYPKESDLVNEHNIYWLWIFPEGVLPVPELEN